GAFQILFRAAPGEFVAYCDDDFYFEPGWLEAHLRILEAYPKVGMVSGYVVPTFFDPARISSNISFSQESQVAAERGKFIQETWIRDWAISTGREPAQALVEAEEIKELSLTFQGVTAFAAANHDQFVAPKAVAVSALPDRWSGRLMGEMIEFDERVNSMGYLRLATTSRMSRHLGNVLPQDLEVGSSSSEVPSRASLASKPSFKARFLRWQPVRSLLLGIYSHLFRWINPE
ncbi:MAG: glycosyltransferase family A protein, partial [Anaerolineales bacterium]